MHRAAADMHNGGSQYAMGWVRSQLGSDVSVWHDGTTTVGFASHVVLLRERHIGVVVLSNVYSFGPADFADPLSTIAEGVAVQQAGAVQAPNAVNLTTAFAIFDGLALVLMSLAVGSLVQLLRGRATAFGNQSGQQVRRGGLEPGNVVIRPGNEHRSLEAANDRPCGILR